ncbi:unnamed protein product, partial [Ectocarpus sp. 8 AP-2014]
LVYTTAAVNLQLKRTCFKVLHSPSQSNLNEAEFGISSWLTENSKIATWPPITVDHSEKPGDPTGRFHRRHSCLRPVQNEKKKSIFPGFYFSETGKSSLTEKRENFLSSTC